MCFPVSMGCPVITMWAVWAIAYWYLHLSAVEEGQRHQEGKGGKLLYIFSLCEPFSSLFVRFQSCKPFTREHASLLPLCCRESTTSGLSQLQSEPGFQDKRNDWALQNAFSKTVLFLLCLDLDKTEGKTKGINYFGERYWSLEYELCAVHTAQKLLASELTLNSLASKSHKPDTNHKYILLLPE